MSTRRSSVTMATSVALLCSACTTTTAPPPARSSHASGQIQGPATSPPVPRSLGPGGWIAFDDHNDVFVVRPDGSGLKRLTRDPADEFDPSWSPEANRIAFRVDVNAESANIYIMNADGTGRKDLGRGLSPAWSPDGSEIAYADERGTISIMRPDGSGKRVIPGTDQGEYPSWAPDGRRIAFSDVFPGGHDIYTVNVDGTGLRRLTPGDGSNDWQVAWSPDGSRIAFASDRGSLAGDIYIMGADGSGAIRLTHNGGFSPAWSPDGRSLVFGAGGGLFTIRADGSGLAHVPLAVPGEVGGPDWRS